MGLNGVNWEKLCPQILIYDACGFAGGSCFCAFVIPSRRMTAAGVSMKDICIVARTKKIRDSFQDVLTDQGYQSYSIQQDRIDDRNIDGLRLATMHRVKGLEFPYVFIVSVNEHVVPLDAAIDRTDKISEMETMTAERCLLYVALTRAQKGVYISFYGEKSSFL